MPGGRRLGGMVGVELHFNDVAGDSPMHVAMVPMPTGRRRVEPHTHADFYELVFAVDGEGAHRVGCVDMPMRRGSLTLVRPWDRHGFTVPADGHLRFINVAFPATTWEAFAHVAELDSAVIEQPATPPRAQVPTEEADAVTAEFTRALRAYADGATTLHVIRLLATALPSLHAAWEPHQRSSAMPAWLNRLCTDISSEDNLQAGLPGLRELAGVSRGHLARTMARHLGVTPVQFLTDRRLAHASYLLAATGDSVTKISARCGFSSPSYFGSCFRARYGVTPREFRQQTWGSVPATAPTTARR